MKILTIGRKGTDIVLEDSNKQISRLQAELTIADNGKYYLVDCGSSNGTSVKQDGKWQPVKQEYVKPEDEVRFGGFYSITVSELLKKAGVASPLLLTKA
jgi:pSer/pThr/pTyr-binding forkhead associated (FHA) protein